MWPHELLEERIAERLMRRLEPRLKPIMKDFLSSSEGRDILVEAVTDMVGDLADASGDSGDLTFMEQIVLSLTARMALRPRFRRELMALVTESEASPTP